MRKTNRVMWQDGMFMYPHHFQQQDVYYNNLISNYQLLQPYYNWGFLDFEIDEDFLGLNKIVIRRASGIFPDGTFFDIPNRDDVPNPITIPKDYDNQLLYLGITVSQKHNLNNPTIKKDQLFRYFSVEDEVENLSSNVEDKQSILIGKLNVNLFLKDEFIDHIIRMPFIKIKSSSNGIKLNRSYVAPQLKLIASDNLSSHAHKVLGLLTSYLNSHYTSPYMTDLESTSKSQSENLLILQTISNYKYLLELLVNGCVTTPYCLFNKLVSIAASLNIFSKKLHNQPFKVNYNHLDINSSFEPIISRIEAIFHELNEYIPVELELKNRVDGIYTTSFADLVLDIATTELVLGLELYDINDRENIANIAKIASLENIDNIISLKISGISFVILDSIPSYLPYKKNIIYLKIDKKGDLWNKLIKQKNIAIYLGHKIDKLVNAKLWFVP